MSDIEKKVDIKSVAAMKAFLQEHGIEWRDCLEKSELQSRVLSVLNTNRSSLPADRKAEEEKVKISSEITEAVKKKWEDKIRQLAHLYLYRCKASIPRLIQTQITKCKNGERGAFVQLFRSLAEAEEKQDDRVWSSCWLYEAQLTSHPSWPKIQPYLALLDIHTQVCVCISILDSSTQVYQSLTLEAGVDPATLSEPYLSHTVAAVLKLGVEKTVPRAPHRLAAEVPPDQLFTRDMCRDHLFPCSYPTCGKVASVAGEYDKCSRCRSAAYCSDTCQKAHWPIHKLTCIPVPKPT